MKHLMPEAKSFSKINRACAVTLYPVVGVGKCVFGSQLYTNIFERKLLTNQYLSFESVPDEVMLKMGWVVKKWTFSFWTALTLSKCILIVSLNILPSKYTYNKILCTFWKFDLSSRGVLRRIYTLSIEVLQNFKIIASFCSWAGLLQSKLVANPRRKVLLMMWLGVSHCNCVSASC